MENILGFEKLKLELTRSEYMLFIFQIDDSVLPLVSLSMGLFSSKLSKVESVQDQQIIKKKW